MVTPLLTTKLYIPPVRPELVSRPRLVERLNAGLHRKLTLISAPAGFGKTTLLSEWAAGFRRPVAWVSLDEDDNDPVRFLAYFVAALQTIEANAGESVLNAFQAAQPPPIESLLTTLVNEIAAIPDPFALVLDDYHLISAQPIHDALTFLLDHFPPQMHLVITTRVDPPLPIARLRGRGQLTELRQIDLRFTLDEAAEFLKQIMGLELPADDVTALTARTEGWIAGLQMAAVSMQGRKDIPGFIEAFTGGHEYIVDYLTDEVLSQQPDSLKTFLLQTSILDRLTGPLCDAVTGQGEGQQTLEKLKNDNLFLVSLDDERCWYRYHRLFTDLLRQRLQQTQPDTVPELHRRASEWYEQNGQIAAAIEHALSANDFERAVHLIEQAAESLMLRSEVVTLQGWLEALPDDIVRARPLLCVYHAFTLLLSGRPLDVTEARLRDAVEADTAGDVSGEVATFRAWIAAHQGEMHQYAELSRQAIELLPKESRFFRSIASGFLGLDSLYSGDVDAFDEALRMGQQTGDLTMTVLTLCHSADLAKVQGQLHKAQALYEQALELATERDGQRQPIAGLAVIGMGRLQREWNDLAGAERYFTRIR